MAPAISSGPSFYIGFWFLISKYSIPGSFSIGFCIFVCNHPTGIIDGLVVMNIINEAHPAQMIANDILDFVPNIKNLILPVDWLGTINKKQS